MNGRTQAVLCFHSKQTSNNFANCVNLTLLQLIYVSLQTVINLLFEQM